MFIDIAANGCPALQRSATFRGDHARPTTFRFFGAGRISQLTVYKHFVPTGRGTIELQNYFPARRDRKEDSAKSNG
jgi:hypothetical protein